MKQAILSTLIFILMSVPALAADTAMVYSSPILVLLFVGFCALLIVAQLIPAVLMLLGMTKAAAKQTSKKQKVKI